MTSEKILCFLALTFQGHLTGSSCPEVISWSFTAQYIDKKSEVAGKTSSNLSDSLSCISYCWFQGDRTAVIFDPNTSLCTCHNLPLSMLTWTTATGATAFGNEDLQTDIVVSWVTNILGYSSFFESLLTSYPPSRLLGASDVYPSYGNDIQAWSPGERTADEYVEVAIDEDIYIYELHIYEVFYAGGVETVSILDPNSNWAVVWRTPGLQIIEESRIFIPKFVPPRFKSRTVRIDLDLATTNVWSEFDAIRVIGSRTRTRTPLF